MLLRARFVKVVRCDCFSLCRAAGLQFVDDGLLVCGMDGALRFFPFNAA